MILGIGTDICAISRIEKTLTDRFIKRCFTPAEISRAERQKSAKARISSYAKRWAAKEACAKALGMGIDHGVYLKDIGVVNGSLDLPKITVSGGALKRLKQITPKGMTAAIDLSLSDDGGYAVAFVVISAVTVRKKK